MIISDTGDSVFGGAPGDSTAILREMVAQQITSLALVPMVDPEVVDIAIKAGVGSEIHVQIGAKQSADYHQPLDLTAKVAAIGGGRIEAGVIGIDSFDMGRAVLLAKQDRSASSSAKPKASAAITRLSTVTLALNPPTPRWSCSRLPATSNITPT